MNSKENLSKDESRTDSSKKPLSQLVREARISLNLSQRAFANKLDITQAQLCRLENGTSKKPNRRTLQALLPYLQGYSYEDLLAMAGYSIDFMDPEVEDEDLDAYDSESDELAEEFKCIKPELYDAAKGLYQFLDNPKNLILIQKVFNLVKAIGMKGNVSGSEAVKQTYLRDCILNLLQ